MWSLISLEALFISAIVFGFLGRYIAKQKNRNGAEGFWLGALFSALGVIIVALLPNKERDYYIESDKIQSEGINITELDWSSKLLFYTLLLIVIFFVIYGYSNS